MSGPKRALAELPQAQATPRQYGPTTPHAIRALQQRSGTKLRSARSVRHLNANSTDPKSARGILRRFAKITAPVTRKRIVTPRSGLEDKENQLPINENNDDENEIQQPNMTFAIEESIEEDSELPAAPTPSVLPEDDESDDEQATITFQNLQSLRSERTSGERPSRRKSRLSVLPQSEPAIEPEIDEMVEDGNTTIMTERGRRAISEEATGRLSRYSFGSIRMSDFGSELEVRRESDRQQKTAELDADDDYGVLGPGDDPVEFGGETENLRSLRPSSSPLFIAEESVYTPGLGDDTFQLEMPDVDEQNVAVRDVRSGQQDHDPRREAESEEELRNSTQHPASSRSSKLLQLVAAKAQPKKRKRVKLTRHGNTVPSLPVSLIKRIALETQEKAGRRKPVLGKDHIKALEQATEWFFEQVGEDLAAYSSHGRRKKRIDADDVLLLMRRQRVASESGQLQAMARDWLPKELLEKVDLPEKP